MLIVGTGHRFPSYEGSSNQVLNDLAEACIEEYKPDIVVSGMALGWDLALANAAFRLSVSYFAAIPFRGQELKWKNEDQELYTKLVRGADHAIVLSEYYGRGVMQDRNIWMVNQMQDDQEDFLLALWNGSAGGTKNCIKYAEAKEKKIINVWEIYLQIGGRE